MFKYTPRKDILSRLASARKRRYPAYYNVLSEIAQEFGYGTQHERYTLYNVFSNWYQNMSAYYSPTRLKHFVPCHGFMVPVEAFTEEKIDAA